MKLVFLILSIFTSINFLTAADAALAEKDPEITVCRSFLLENVAGKKLIRGHLAKI